LRRWEAVMPNAELSVPKPNPFLPRSLDLKAPRTPFPPRGVSPPAPMERQRDKQKWCLLFRQDTTFGVPKAYAFIELVTPYPKSSPRNLVLGRLYEQLLEDSLTESFLYDASVAGLTFSLSTTARGLQLFFGGYDDRLVDFAQTVLKAVRDFGSNLDLIREKFEAQRDVIKREYTSFDSQQPFQQAAYWSRLATSAPQFAIEDLRSEALKVSYQDVADFSTQVLKEPKFAYALVQGNVRGEEADSLATAVDNIIGFPPLLQGGLSTEPRMGKLPVKSKGPGCSLVHDAFDAVEENSSITVIFQTGIARAADGEKGRNTWAATTVLGSLLKDRFYGELRTKQQLGYIVTSATDRKEGVLRLVFVVQGTALGPMGMMERTDAFLNGIESELEKKGQLEVQEQAATLSESRLARAQQLAASVGDTFSEVASREFKWDRAVLEAAALKRVTLADVLALFRNCVAPGGTERRRLNSMIFGSRHKNDRSKAESALEASGGLLIKDAQAFMAASEKWPNMAA